MQNLIGKNIAIVGAGLEGFSSALYLVQKGASITVLDQRQEHELSQHSLKEATDAGVKFVLGKDYLADLSRFDLVVRSPGVKRETIEKALGGKKVTITSQTQLFLENCPCLVIGVTGTKGKGTTSSLTSEMLKDSGFDSHLGGNIGTPPLEFLDKLTPTSRVVLELSSFQLIDLTISPQIGVLLMVTSEHLDYHKDYNEYVDSKRNLLRFQKTGDSAIINRDYPASNESDILTDARVFYVSRERPSTEEGCFVKDNGIWVRMQGQVNSRSAPKGVQGTEWKIIDTDKIALLGKHNLENVCAAVMAATLAGAEKQAITKVLATFKGLEHRLELVKEINGVKYYDDSFSTTPETAIAAIEAFDVPEILVLGGASKKSDFRELGEKIVKARNIKAVIGIGEEWPIIKQAIEDAVVRTGQEVPVLYIEGETSMQHVVQAAVKLAKPGDIVLLSPACKSFDMFKDYKDRGEQFKKEVGMIGVQI